MAHVKMKTRTEESLGWYSKVTQFFVSSWEELKKVYYPTKTEALQQTLRVMTLIIVCSLILGLIDLSLGVIMNMFLKT